MKRIFNMIWILLLLNTTGNLYAQSLSLTTYFPSPIGAYDRLRLIPQATLAGPCDIGSLYVESVDRLRFCADNSGSGAWGYLNGVWSQAGSDIFPTATAPGDNLKIGIGTSTPNFKLTVINDGSIFAKGIFGSGAATGQINGTRLMWYPRSASLRIGTLNVANDDPNSSYSNVTGGLNNRITAALGTVVGGDNNYVAGESGVVAGGSSNTTGNEDADENSAIGGGLSNTINGSFSSIVGGRQNTAHHDYSSIGGGYLNELDGYWSTILGGQGNSSGDGSNEYSYNTIGGGQNNTLDEWSTSIVGGSGNSNQTGNSFIIGGLNNTNEDAWGAGIIGGRDNFARWGNIPKIGGGWNNQVDRNGSIIVGGQDNSTDVWSQICVILGGKGNESRRGSWGFVPGGEGNISTPRSFVGGRNMQLTDAFLNLTWRHFVWGHANTPTVIDGFADRGSVIIYSGNVGIGNTNPVHPLHLASGARVQDDGDICSNAFCRNGVSDRRLKRNIKPLTEPLAMLYKIRGITFEWNHLAPEFLEKGKVQYGFIAQELEKDFPQWVGENTEGFKVINVKGLEAILTESIKKMDQKVTKAIPQLEKSLKKEQDELERIKRKYGQ